MGNLIVFKSELREEMKTYATLTLKDVKKLVHRFDSLQESFGWGIGLDTFTALFKLKKNDPETKQLWKLWDTDGNGVTDVLEILSALTLISIGKFEEKLAACFSLFDFDENQVLTLDEMTILIRTSVCGLCKLLDMVEPPAEDIDRLSTKAFSVVGTGSKSITKEQFLKWVVCTPTIITTVCRFGTVNPEATKRKYAEMMAEDKAALKIQMAFKSSKSTTPDGSVSLPSPSAQASHTLATYSSQQKTHADSTPASVASSPTSATHSLAHHHSAVHSKVDSHRRKDDPNYYSFDFSVHAVRRAKFIFDQIDRDKSGTISIKELAGSMSGQEFAGVAVGAFRAMDSDGNGTLSFDEMLKVLYPNAKPRDIQLMLREVNGVPVDKATIQALQMFFESNDDDFDSKVVLKEIIAKLAADNVFKRFVESYQINAKLADKPVGFTTLLSELFQKNPSSSKAGPSSNTNFAQIVQWSKMNGPIYALDAKQQAELETLFQLYDTDGSGFITLNELRDHFSGLGFSKDEVARLFSKYDTEHGGASKKIDLKEFKKFYRNVWDSSARMNGDSAVSKLSQAVSHNAASSTNKSKAEKDMEDQYR